MSKTAYLRPFEKGTEDNPTAEWSHSGGVGLNPFADACDLVAPVVTHNDLKYITIVEPDTDFLIGFLLYDKPNDIDTINFLDAHIRAKDTTPDVTGPLDQWARVRFKVILRGSSWFDTAFDLTGLATITNYTSTAHLTNPATSTTVWFPSDIADPTLELAVDPTQFSGETNDAIQAMSLYISVNYEPIPPQDFGGHDAASRKQFFFSRPPPLYKPAPTLHRALAIDILDRVSISDGEGPHAGGVGWLSEKWQRRPFRKVADVIQPGSNVVPETLRDMQDHRVLVSYSGQVKRAGPSQDGIVFFSSGSTLTITRASNAWMADPAQPELLIASGFQQPKLGLAIPPDTGATQNGTMLEHARTPWVPQSSFRNQLLGWTFTADDGSPASTVVAVTTPLRFDNGSEYVAEFTAGTTATTDSQLAITTASVPANSYFNVEAAAYSKTGATVGITAYLKRNADGLYYDHPTEWSASGAALFTILSVGGWERKAISSAITIGTGADTLTLELRQLSTETDAAVSYVGHAQIVTESYPAAALITEATPAAAAVDLFEFSNAAGARSVNNAQGAVACTFTPNWDKLEAGNSGEATFIVWDMRYHADDRFSLWWHVGNDRWEFRSRTSTVNSIAFHTAAPQPTRGVPLNLVARWIGSEGEHGLAPYTASIFVNGVKGTDAVATAQPVETTVASALGPCDGTVSKFVSLAYAPSDEECARFPWTANP